MRYLVKYLLRGLGVSVLPKILTTHFYKNFLQTNVTPKNTSSQAKLQKNETEKNIFKKRRKTDIYR